MTGSLQEFEELLTSFLASSAHIDPRIKKI